MTHLSQIHQSVPACLCVCVCVQDRPCPFAAVVVYSDNGEPLHQRHVFDRCSWPCDEELCVFPPSRGCVLPLTDAEQQLSEIREACYEGKTKKVQLSWTPQLRASFDQTVFSIHKGVKTFDLSQKHSLLVTGGMDRLIRMWNPHFSG